MAAAMPSDNSPTIRSPEYQLPQSYHSANLSRSESQRAFNIAIKNGVEAAATQHETLFRTLNLDHQETIDLHTLRAAYASSGASESVQGQASLEPVVPLLIKRNPVNEANTNRISQAPASTAVLVDRDLEEEIEVTERLKKKATNAIASRQFVIAERVLTKVLRRYQGLAVQYPTEDYTAQLASTYIQIANTLEKQERYTESLASLYAASYIKPTEAITTRIIKAHIRIRDYAIALSLATDTLTHYRNLYRKEDERRNEILALKIHTLLLQDEYDEAEAYYKSIPSASIFYLDLKHHFNDQEIGPSGLNPCRFENESRNSIPDLPEPVQSLRSLNISQPPKFIENLRSLSDPVPQDSISVLPLRHSTITDSKPLKVDDARTSIVQKPANHSGCTRAVPLSPDGNQIASASSDKTVEQWNATTGNLYKTLIGHSGAVWTVTFSLDSKQLASGCSDNTIKLWNAKTGNLHKTLTGHSSCVNAVAFSPDGKLIASASNDNKIKLWNATTGKRQKTLTGHSSCVNTVAFSPDGKQIASGSNDNTIKLWDATTGKYQKTLTVYSSCVWSVAFSPDGKQLASGCSDNAIKLWNTTTGNLHKTLISHSDSVLAVAFSPDGKQIASGSNDKTIKLWNAKTGNLHKTLTGHSGRVWSVAFSPDGKQIASASDDKRRKLQWWNKTVSTDKMIKLWNAKTGNLHKTLTGHSNTVWAVAFSPDGKQIASGSVDNTIKLWNATTSDP